jgi:hypothetical protein
MIAQNGFGLPLRQAALKFILTPDTSESRGRDLLQTRSEQLNLPDAHAGAKKWLDEASPLDDIQRLRSTTRGLRPCRTSSHAANNPAGPVPTIRTAALGSASPVWLSCSDTKAP